MIDWAPSFHLWCERVDLNCQTNQGPAFVFPGKTKGKGTFGKVKQGTHNPTNEKVITCIGLLNGQLKS